MMQDVHVKLNPGLQWQKHHSFHQQIRLKFKEETSKLENSFLQCQNLDTSEIKSEIPEKFLNVVPEKDGEDRLGRSCEK
jgi:hypothetical protein